MTDNIISTSTILINSNHATYTTSVNIAGYSLSATSITIGTRGILSGSGSILCSSNFDSYNGTTSGSWSLTMTGTNPYIKTTAGNTINGLTWTGTNLRLASSLNVTKTFWVGGTYTLGTKSITVGTNTNVTVTSGNSWTLMGQTRYWGKVNITGELTCATSVSVWCNASSAVNGSVSSNIILHSNAYFTFRGTIGKLYLETVFHSTFYANGTWERIYWNTTGAWTFRPSISPWMGDVQSKSAITIITELTHYMTLSNINNYEFVVHINTWNVLNSEYGWQLTNLGAESIYSYHMSVFTSESKMSLFVDNVYENTYNVVDGYLEIYDTEESNYEEQYYLIPGEQTSMTVTDWNQVWLILFFFVIMTIFNFVGYFYGIGIMQLLSMIILISGMFVNQEIWDTMPMLPLAFVLINVVMSIMGIAKGR